MRISDVVKQIRAVLPNYTDLFGDALSISGVSATGGVATITTTGNHGLVNGQAVTIVGVETRTPISGMSQDGLKFTFTTSQDHDLTFNWPEHNQVELGGFTDSAWNDSFKLLSSDNRQTFSVQSVNTLPTLNGNEYLLENRIDGVNGVYAVTVTGNTTFTISGGFSDGIYTPINGKIFGQPRVASVVDIDRALDEYTAQNVNDFWIFVEPKDVDVSKDRSTFSDATATIASGNDIRTRMIDGFTVYIVAPTTEQIAAEDAVDICRHDLLLPMMKTLYGTQFDTGVSCATPDFRTTLNSHRVAAYEKAFLVYSYEFEVVIDLTNDDQVDPTATRAFRDIDYTLKIGGDDTTNMMANINLDDTPL